MLLEIPKPKKRLLEGNPKDTGFPVFLGFESSKCSFTAVNHQTDPKKDAKQASKFKSSNTTCCCHCQEIFYICHSKKGMCFFLEPGCIEGTQTVPNRSAPHLAICEATRRVATYWPPKGIRMVMNLMSDFNEIYFVNISGIFRDSQ